MAFNEGSAALAGCVAEQRAAGSRKGASTKSRQEYFDLPTSPPWPQDRKPDHRQQDYLDTVLANAAKNVAEAEPGARNDTLFVSAMKCASFVAGVEWTGTKRRADWKHDVRQLDLDGFHTAGGL